MELTTLIAFFSFQLTILAVIAIVHKRDKLADKAISGLTKLLDRLASKPAKQNTKHKEKSPRCE